MASCLITNPENSANRDLIRGKGAILPLNKQTNMFYFQIGDGIVESGQWEVPGYANGLYMRLAIGGKVMWEEATM